MRGLVGNRGGLNSELDTARQQLTERLAERSVRSMNQLIKLHGLEGGTAGRMTTVEAAEYLGVRAQTLAVWRCAKRYPELPYIKVGQHVRYRQSDLDKWLESRTVGGAE